MANPDPWSTACPDWEERIVEGRPLTPLSPLFPEQAALALRYFNDLRLVDVAGSPLAGDVCRPWVLDFVAQVFGSYDGETGRRLINEFFLLISKKNGKALALDTEIPTPNGWTTMGALDVGDEVFGVDGKPCSVTATSEVFVDHQCYRIGFSNGESVIADAGHLWMTRALADAPGNGKGNGGDRTQRRRRVRTTQEIADTLLRPYDGARNHSMPMPAPLEAAEALLPVAPYTLGAWLGDGHSAAAEITCHRDDTQILDEIAADGWPIRYASNNGSAASTYAISDGDRSQSARGVCLAARLRRLGVLNNKHIPAEYLRASREQRLALLQGLMDTDGTINKNGRVLSYCGANEQLVRGVAELLATFGVKYSWTTRPATCSGKPAGEAHHLQFMAFRDELPVFRLRRKLERMRSANEGGNSARSQTVQFVSAEKVGSVPVRCITVDSPDHQFLFGRTMLPTHNSTISAGIMLVALLLNWRQSAEYIIIAPSLKAANNSSGAAMDMVEADEDLLRVLRPVRHERRIEHRTTGATLRILSADNDVVAGVKATGVLIDELWLFGNKAKAEALLREAKGGLASRPEGFVIALSTQGDDPPAGVFKQWLDRFRDIRDGKLHAPRSLGILYEFPRAMVEAKQHLDPDNWYVTNPNLGASVDMDFLLDEFEKANSSGEGSVRGFLAKHLNVEIGLNLRANRWRGADYWEKTADKSLTWQTLLDRCDVVTVGIDGGGLDDLLGVTLVGRDARDGRKWYSVSRAYCAAKVLELRKSEAPRLLGFAKDGDLVIREDNDMEAAVAEIVELVAAVRDTGKLASIGVDQIGAGAIIPDFAEHNIIPVMAPQEQQGDRLLEGIAQGWKLKGAIYTSEIKLANGTFRHADQPLMDFCVSNAKAEMSGNAVMITKQAAGVGKIDPLIALFCAVVPMERNPQAVGGSSVYSSSDRPDGFLVI